MDSSPSTDRSWASAEWLATAVSWLDEVLAGAGMTRTGELTQPTLRPWGTVLNAPTDHGAVWLKAPGVQNVFEVELYRHLRQLAPKWTLEPIAVNVERGWLVLPDGGSTLGDRMTDTDLVDALVEVLPQYGQLQRQLSPRVEQLLTAGITDMRASVMPQRFDEAVRLAGEFTERNGDASGFETLRRVVAMRATYVSCCDRLAAATVPSSLDHNDLHPWNVFVTGPGEPVQFYDWGDSVVAHPFASMRLGLGFVSGHLGVGQDDPAVLRCRDAYLEVFGDLAPHAELVAELELACLVGKVARSLTWARALRGQGGAEAGEFADAPVHCLAELLSGKWIGFT